VIATVFFFMSSSVVGKTSIAGAPLFRCIWLIFSSPAASLLRLNTSPVLTPSSLRYSPAGATSDPLASSLPSRKRSPSRMVSPIAIAVLSADSVSCGVSIWTLM